VLFAGRNSLNLRVLIADTDPELRRRLQSRLLELEIPCDTVATAAEAYERLNEASYALVVADVGLPNGGVEHVISRIARLERARRPIVLILAATAEAARSLDIEIVQIVLRRPVEVSKLVDLVRNCVFSTRVSRRKSAEDADGDQPRS
jgi:DNA-binding response OmpR family regulator